MNNSLLNSRVDTFSIRLAELEARIAKLEDAAPVIQCPTGKEDVELATSIVSAIAKFYRLSRKEMLSRTRGPASTSWARMLAMYLVRKFTRLSLEETGRILNREHTSVLHGAGAIAEEMDKNRIAEIKSWEAAVEKMKAGV